MFTKIKAITFLLALLVSASAFAQSNKNGAVTLIGSRFTYPYLREIIADFKAAYPDVEIQLLERGTDAEDNANLIINGHELSPEELRKGYRVISFGRYVILPVANAKNPLLAQLTAEGLDKKEIKALFFNKEYDSIYNEKKEKERESKLPARPNVHLFTRDQNACAPAAFAAYYGLKQDNLLGKRIVGSDLSLLYAVKSDPQGITYNIPVHLFNLETRLPLQEWTIIPIDQDGDNSIDNEEDIYQNLDQLLDAIASNDVQNVPTANINISLPEQINSENQNLSLFVDFLLSSGQTKARKYGFVGLSKEQSEKLRSQLTNKL